MSPILSFLLHTNYKPWYSVTQHDLSFLINLGGGIIDLQCCNYCYLSSDFSSNFNHQVMTIFHHKLLTREGRGIGHWMNSSILHDNICSFIQKKSCHSNIIYHMTLHLYLVYLFIEQYHIANSRLDNLLGTQFWTLANRVHDINTIIPVFIPMCRMDHLTKLPVE